MQTPYIPHVFGEPVEQKLRSRTGWLTAGIASSIPWPKHDVWVKYDNDDFFLRGLQRGDQASPPGITVACDRGQVDEAIAKVYRFTSVLGWFKGGYVDVVGYISGSHPILYGDQRKVFSTTESFGEKSFNCNHMPLVETDNARKALAFWREGQRLRDVHHSYAFLSFYKVIESQFSTAAPKVAWFEKNIERLSGRCTARISELRTSGTNISRHLFESGRCAIAHASLNGEIVDPDIPSDRRRLASDLDIIEELAHRFISNELQIPTEMVVYKSRDRLAPWNHLLPLACLDKLRKRDMPDDMSGLEGLIVSVGLWPDGPIPGMERMTIRVDSIENGIVKILLFNQKMTLFLVFFLDYCNSRVHTNLEDGGLCRGENEPDELDVLAHATFFYRVLGNRIAELTCDGIEPIDCEIVIPVNIIPPNPETAIAEAVNRFRLQSRE